MSTSPPVSGKIAIVLGFLLGTWSLLDGIHHFITGDYVRWRGRVALWERLVAAAGLNPAQFAVVLVLFGIAWMIVANLYLFQNSLPSWKAMAVLIVLSSWLVGLPTILLLAQLTLLIPARSALRHP